MAGPHSVRERLGEDLLFGRLLLNLNPYVTLAKKAGEALIYCLFVNPSNDQFITPQKAAQSSIN